MENEELGKDSLYLTRLIRSSYSWYYLLLFIGLILNSQFLILIIIYTDC